MPPFATYRQALGLALFAAAVLALLLAGPPGAPGSAAVALQEKGKVGKYMGAESCQFCHEAGPKGKADAADLVRLDEYAIWKKMDKHSQAYDVLVPKNNIRAERMWDNLKGRPGWDKEFTKELKCLNCHAVVAPEDRQGKGFSVTDGVSCDGCHGPSNGWFDEHFTSNEWRTQSPAYKHSKGMIDLRDPAERGATCVSCHVGNLAEGKVVTHEMYAAGHPPLPGFELDTFSEALPKHWRLMKDVPLMKKLDAKVRKEVYHYDEGELEQTRLVTIGALVALRDSMRLLADQATPGPKHGQAWPELAQFDCYACHHDLQIPSWRQERGYTTKPGRPPVRSWPILQVEAVAELMAANPAERAAFEPKRAALLRAIDDHPFGDPKAVAAAANALAEWADKQIAAARGKRYDAAFAQKALTAFASTVVAHQGDKKPGPALDWKKIPEYDAARQIAWSCKAISFELEPDLAKTDPERHRVLEALDKQLRLTIPVGRYPVVEKLDDVLARINAYQPAPTAKLLFELSKLPVK